MGGSRGQWRAVGSVGGSGAQWGAVGGSGSGGGSSSWGYSPSSWGHPGKDPEPEAEPSEPDEGSREAGGDSREAELMDGSGKGWPPADPGPPHSSASLCNLAPGEARGEEEEEEEKAGACSGPLGGPGRSQEPCRGSLTGEAPHPSCRPAAGFSLGPSGSSPRD